MTLLSGTSAGTEPVPKIWGYHCPNGQW